MTTTYTPARKLRVCHISTVHPLHDPRILYLECRSIADAGHDVTYMVQADEDNYVLDGIRIRSVGKKKALTAGLRLKLRVTRLLNTLKLARSLDADIYHIHDPELIPLAVWLRMRSGKLVIFDAHEDDVAYVRQKHYINPALRAILTFLMVINVRLAARGLSAIIVCDQGVKDLYCKHYGAKKVIIAHNFPRLNVFTVSDDAPPVEQKYDLVYHGSIPGYHLEVAFEVAEELRRRNVLARWYFFGNCPQIEWAKAEIARRDLHDYVTIYNKWIPYTEVLSEVRSAKIGFIPLPDLPKFQTNIPSKLFEFMALRMPTVLSDLPPSRPFVGDGQCAIMVKPDNYSAYADAIIKLINDKELRQRMGEIARQRIVERYNWEHEANEILKIYDELTH